jgi:hypothetical protein
MAAVVEALVIFDGNHQPALACLVLDLMRLGGFENQRLDAQDILPVVERRHHSFKVQMIRHTDDNQLSGRQPGQHFGVGFSPRAETQAVLRVSFGVGERVQASARRSQISIDLMTFALKR